MSANALQEDIALKVGDVVKHKIAGIRMRIYRYTAGEEVATCEKIDEPLESFYRGQDDEGYAISSTRFPIAVCSIENLEPIEKIKPGTQLPLL